jgi:membrane-associated phospholipid phosphatase
LRWQNSDWDPALRFWTQPWDPNLTEWLRGEDPSLPSIQAACEFAGQWQLWQYSQADLLNFQWLAPAHLTWLTGPNPVAFIQAELEELFIMMEDDRDRYLAEAHFQADGLPAYMIHFLGIDSQRRPWTLELMRCGLAIANLVYMYYKAYFRRVRPSFICPGLVPPFGPPRHPAFPSGHSFAGHFLALLLLDIPGVAAIYGEDPGPLLPPNDPLRPRGLRARIGRQVTLNEVRSNIPFGGPLLWLANRLAMNRERIGVHYPSDSAASRWLAGAVWAALTNRAGFIDCPTLRAVMRQAAAEWVRT